MKYILPPLSSFRRRDRAVIKLLWQGHATDDELFAAQYPEWPAKGLHKDSPRNDRVDFRDYWQDRKGFNPLYLLFSWGYVDSKTEERELFLNRLLLSPLGHVLGALATRTAWARIHNIVDLGAVKLPATVATMGASLLWSSYRYAAASAVKSLLLPSIGDTVGHEHIHVMQFKSGLSKIPQTEFEKAAKAIAKRRKSYTIKQGIDTFLSLMPRAYFRETVEKQARLHNIIVQGYPAWGRIPSSREELFAALHDRGIKTPPQYEAWLGAPEQKSLRDTFSCAGRTFRAFVNPASAEINIGLHSWHDADVTRIYWEKYLPSLYADLLVLYGDSQGRERLGFGQQVRAPVFMQG